MMNHGRADGFLNANDTKTDRAVPANPSAGRPAPFVSFVSFVFNQPGVGPFPLAGS